MCVAAFVATACFVGVLLPSCSAAFLDRRITIEIPQHPWERYDNDSRIWYSLKWSYGRETKNLYVSPEERVVQIDVPIGETVFVCAFPLGEMRPFGAVVTPFDSSSSFVLGQDDGYLASILLDADRDATKGINYKALKEAFGKVEDEFLWNASSLYDGPAVLQWTMALDKVRFLRDVMNGELCESSIVFLEPFEVPGFAVPNGVWIGESVLGSYIVVKDSMMPPLWLCEGVHRFYNPAMDRELVVVVDERGGSFRYMRQALV